MSMPLYTVTCTGCNHESTKSYIIRFIYEGIPEREPDITKSWCQDCDKIVDSCVPFTRNPIVPDMSFLLSPKKQKRSFFSFFKKSESEETQPEVEIDPKLQLRVLYFEQTKFVSKCLFCGGSNLLAISYSNFDLYSDGPFFIGIEHKCGGQLQEKENGSYNLSRLPEVYFNEQGEVIHDERGI